MTALLHSCRRLVMFALVIPWLVNAAPFNASAQDWPEIAAEGQLVGRWEVWHDNQGQMREYVQIVERSDGSYVAFQSYQHYGGEITAFREIALRLIFNRDGARNFRKVDDPHGEAYWVMADDGLAVAHPQGVIPVFDTTGQSVAAVPPVGRANEASARAASQTTSGEIDPYRQALVRNYAIEEIRNRLVSPRSARFSSLWETEVRHVGNWTYIVAGHVDARNRAGTRVRFQWAAEVECYNEGGSTCRVTRAGLED